VIEGEAEGEGEVGDGGGYGVEEELEVVGRVFVVEGQLFVMQGEGSVTVEQERFAEFETADGRGTADDDRSHVDVLRVDEGERSEGGEGRELEVGVEGEGKRSEAVEMRGDEGVKERFSTSP
jgi:hypothetical protein